VKDFLRVVALLVVLGVVAIGVNYAWDYFEEAAEPKPLLQESVMIPTADGRTIECLIFDRGVSCNWGAP
jgi:hypothetical protein